MLNILQSFELYRRLTYINFYSYWIGSISTFVSLAGIPIEITSSAIGLKICVINVTIKKYKPRIKKMKKKHGKVLSFRKI